MRVLLAVGLLAAALNPAFRNVGAESGLDFKLVSGQPGKPYILESMSGGVGFIDYDNDGWVDIYLVNGSTLEAERNQDNLAEDRLYRNNGDGAFTDVTQKAGLGSRQWGLGVAVGDVNNDGFDDLYVTNYGPNRLYLNNGDGAFRDFSRESGAAGAEWSSSAAFGDYDQDGDLDLYVSNYLEFDVNHLPKDSKLCRYRGIKVQCGPRGIPATADRFYENQGDGRFTDVTAKSGIGEAPASYGLGVTWADYDNDGDADIYVANDSLPNFLFENNGDKTFSDAGLLAGAALSDDGREQAGMGVDFGDFDNDGDFDLVVTNFSDDYTTLYRNDGDGQFADISYAAGIGQSSWTSLSWGVQFVDLNLDGYLDIVGANGHVYPEVDQHDLGTSYRQLNSLFLNKTGGEFEESAKDFGPAFREAEASRGLAVGDIDNDGQMDLLIANLDAPPSLIRNPGASGHWILVKLKGTVSNRSAIGARVTLTTGSRIQMREVRSGGSYQSQSDLRLHFGLGSSEVIDGIEIRWPNGRVQRLENVKSNQVLVVEEPHPD